MNEPNSDQPNHPPVPVDFSGAPRFVPEECSPGPWRMEDSTRGRYTAFYIVDDKGQDVATVFSENGGREDEANARLLKAAPALLLACIAVVEGRSDAAQLARDAINNAATMSEPRAPRVSAVLDHMEARGDVDGLRRLGAHFEELCCWEKLRTDSTDSRGSRIRQGHEWAMVATKDRRESMEHRAAGRLRDAQRAELGCANALSMIMLELHPETDDVLDVPDALS